LAVLNPDADTNRRLIFEISVSAGADCLAGASLSGFHLMAFAKAHAGPPAVLVDELDAGGF
jgi:hypothetical protein